MSSLVSASFIFSGETVPKLSSVHKQRFETTKGVPESSDILNENRYLVPSKPFSN